MTPTLNLNNTYKAIIAAAKDRKFITYGDIAKAQNLEWSKVRYAMNSHLETLLRVSAANDWPLITAIVVNQGDGYRQRRAIKAFDFEMSHRLAIVVGEIVERPANFDGDAVPVFADDVEVCLHVCLLGVGVSSVDGRTKAGFQKGSVTQRGNGQHGSVRHWSEWIGRAVDDALALQISRRINRTKFRRQAEIQRQSVIPPMEGHGIERRH